MNRICNQKKKLCVQQSNYQQHIFPASKTRYIIDKNANTINDIQYSSSLDKLRFKTVLYTGRDFFIFR